MNKISILIVVVIMISNVKAAEKMSDDFCVNKWEYFSKSFTLGNEMANIGNWKLSDGLTKAGEKGWELVNVVAVNKVQFAIFKRPRNECVNNQALKANPGLKKPTK